jgi:diguanylate cyclase (GGDEF)-like protein
MPAQVVLLTDDAEQRNRWTEALSQASGVQLLDGAEVSQANLRPDIVVADRLPITINGADLSGSLAEGRLGLVLVGCRGTADVSLPVNCTSRELRLACQLLTQIVRLRRQVARERKARRLLSQLAQTDALTSLENRRAWDDHLDERCDHVVAGERRGCLVLLDLDHFKRVNERWGHLAGDDVLRRFGQDLKRLADPDGFAARLGGDEFALMLAGRDGVACEHRVELVRQALRQELVLDDSPVEITVSAGYVELWSGLGLSTQEVLARADAALRDAKQRGRDCSVQG